MAAGGAAPRRRAAPPPASTSAGRGPARVVSDEEGGAVRRTPKLPPPPSPRVSPGCRSASRAWVAVLPLGRPLKDCNFSVYARKSSIGDTYTSCSLLRLGSKSVKSHNGRDAVLDPSGDRYGGNGIDGQESTEVAASWRCRW